MFPGQRQAGHLLLMALIDAGSEAGSQLAAALIEAADEIDRLAAR